MCLYLWKLKEGNALGVWTLNISVDDQMQILFLPAANKTLEERKSENKIWKIDYKIKVRLSES